MIHSTYYLAPNGVLTQGLSLDQLQDALEESEGLTWVDIQETTADDGTLLTNLFHFHPLAVEDCVETQIHPPKIDDYGDYIFTIFHGVNHSVESDIVETAELAIFIGKNFVVSNHNFPLYSVEEIRYQLLTDNRLMKRGPDFLAYSLIDALIDNVLPTIDRMSDITEAIEADSLGKPGQNPLEAILRLKRSVRKIHRTMVPQRDLLNRLSRGEFALIKEESLVFYRDVYDHMVRIEDLNLGIRDGAENALSTYLSSVANRQNETMKVLAIAGAIFLPLTLLAGIYGMNFDYMPELHWRWAYFAVLGVVVAVVLGALTVFWRRGWFRIRKPAFEGKKTFSVERDLLRGHLPHPTKGQEKD
ncbi:MAG: magnesium/cobalt transporter CorA [Dehalococcoidia bacterium]|nr:magnesium/cobalt transporter CorA [Dehalococcoidia bacterium]